MSSIRSNQIRSDQVRIFGYRNLANSMAWVGLHLPSAKMVLTGLVVGGNPLGESSMLMMYSFNRLYDELLQPIEHLSAMFQYQEIEKWESWKHVLLYEFKSLDEFPIKIGYLQVSQTPLCLNPA